MFWARLFEVNLFDYVSKQSIDGFDQYPVLSHIKSGCLPL